MTNFQSLAHSMWDRKYHVVFVPKCRKKVLYGKIRQFLVPKLKELAQQKECAIISGNMVQDHVHMVIAIPPKHSPSAIIGYLKGKSAIAIARQFGGKQRNFNGEQFWARGYAISTIGFEASKILEYVKHQERLDGAGSNEDGSF